MDIGEIACMLTFREGTVFFPPLRLAAKSTAFAPVKLLRSADKAVHYHRWQQKVNCGENMRKKRLRRFLVIMPNEGWPSCPFRWRPLRQRGFVHAAVHMPMTNGFYP